MAEWWLLDESTQDRIAAYIDAASDRVIDNFDAHGNENSLTAALGQELSREILLLGDTTVIFKYRNFLEQNEEPLVGADGGIAVTITNQDEVVEKGVFYQAKRLPQYTATRSLQMTIEEAGRLKRQAIDMLDYTTESIVLVQTRRNFYAIDASPIASEPIDNLLNPLWNARLITLGTYLGKWVSRCSRGDTRRAFVEGIRKPKGFLNHFLEMNIDTRQRPMLTEGGQPIDFGSLFGDAVPIPRWRETA